MAKGKIRGITVEIGGDTTKLGKALDGVNQKSRELQSELKGVNSLLKFDPSNVTLLKQKQDLLTQSITETKNKLNILKDTQSQVQAQFERGDITVEQYRDFQREIVATEQKLERLTDQMHEFGSASATVIANAGNSIKDFGGKMTEVGKTMTTNVTAPIVAGAVAISEGTRELRGDLARLETNAEAAGYSLEDMEEHMTQIVGVTGEVDSSIEGLSNLLATGISDEGFAEIMDSLSGAAIKFSDTLKFEGIADGLQETLATGAGTGAFAELLERSGIVLDDFNEGLEKAIKNGTEEDYVLQTLSKTGLAEYYNAYREGNPDLVAAAEAEYKLQTQLAELGKLIAPIVAKFTEFAAKVLEAFNGMSPEAKKFTLIVVGIAAAIGPLIVVIGSVITHVGTILTLAPKFATALNAVKGAFAALNAIMAANPIGAVIVAITAVIAILVTAYNKCDWFRNAVDGVVKDVVKFFKSIPSNLSDLPDKMKKIGKDLLEGLWNGIKNIKSWLIGKVKGLGGSVLGAIREVFDTHSPSKETEKIGENVGEGLAIGIENSTPVAVISATKAGVKVREALTNEMQETVKEIDASREELETKLKSFGQLFKTETDKNGKQIFSLGDLKSDIKTIEAYTNALTKLKKRGLSEKLFEVVTDMDIANALEYMQKLLAMSDSKLKEYIELYEKRDEAAAEAAKQFYDVDLSEAEMVEAIEKANKAVQEELDKQIETMSDKLKDYGELFDTVTVGDVDVFALNDIEDDIKQMERYGEMLNELRGRGITNGLMDEITNMNVDDAVGYMDELLKLSETKLDEYVALYVEKQNLAQQIAAQFYGGEPVIDDSTETALAVGTAGTAENVADKTVESLKENIKTKIQQSQNEFSNIGDMMCAGIEQGVKHGQSRIVNAMVSAVKAAIRAAKAAAAIHSPSHVMRDEVGKQLTAGMAVGITDAMNEPVDAMSDAVAGVIGRGVNVSRDINATFTANDRGVPVGDILTLLSSYLPQIVDASSRQIVLDGGAIVGGTIDAIDARLGQNALLKARGV